VRPFLRTGTSSIIYANKLCDFAEPGNGIKGEPNRIFRNLRGINLYDIEKRQIDGGSSTASAGISSPTGHATTLSSRTGSAVNGIPTGDATTSSSPAGSATNGIPTHSPAGTLSAGGLSSYAKIGIGLGVPLGVLIIGILIFLGYFIGKRRRKTPRYTDSNALPAELVEIGGRERPVAELPTEVNMVELPGSFQSRGSQDKIKTSDVPHSEATLES
jgi:hypothetical protein